MLRRELERAAAKSDDKAIQRACSEIEGLRWRVLGSRIGFGGRYSIPCVKLALHLSTWRKRKNLSLRGNPQFLVEMVKSCGKLCAIYGNFSPKIRLN